jgi:regulator of RNase E activity RraA
MYFGIISYARRNGFVATAVAGLPRAVADSESASFPIWRAKLVTTPARVRNVSRNGATRSSHQQCRH